MAALCLCIYTPKSVEINQNFLAVGPSQKCVLLNLSVGILKKFLIVIFDPSSLFTILRGYLAL